MNIPGFRIEHLTRYNTLDAKELGELRYFESPWKPNEPFDEDLMRQMIEPEDQTIIAAREINTQVICSSEALAAFTMGDAGKFNVGSLGFLGCVSTTPEFRGRGLYGAVWRKGLDWLTERGVSTLLFSSNPNLHEREVAKKIYLKWGAKIIARATSADETDFYRLDVQEGLEIWDRLHP